jgi:hypothetical protein
VGFSIILALVLIGCASVPENFTGEKNGKYYHMGVQIIGDEKWSDRDLYLMLIEEKVIPSWLLLEGETQRDATDRIMDTLPEKYQDMVLIENYLDGYSKTFYETFLSSFAWEGAANYDYREAHPDLFKKSSEDLSDIELEDFRKNAFFYNLSPITQTAIKNRVAAELNTYSPEGIRGSDKLKEWIRIGMDRLISSENEKMKGYESDFRFLARKNVLLHLFSAKERKERYILSLSDREWDLLKLQVQKKQYDELIEEVREQGEKNREQSAARAWISTWNAERIKTSIDQLNNTLRLNQPAYNYNYQR